jgi:predicted homoserine dehydrogenase-like protein
MNLQSMIAAYIAADKPVHVGLIGVGKFGSMFLAQMPTSIGPTAPADAAIVPRSRTRRTRLTAESRMSGDGPP